MNGDVINEAFPALFDAQAEMPTIEKNKANPFHKSEYADLPGILKAVTPILHKHGLMIVQPLDAKEGGSTYVDTLLVHAESGHHIRSSMRLPDIQDPQKIGSAITYYRRYQLLSILGLAPDDEDDDGNNAADKGEKTDNYRERWSKAAEKWKDLGGDKAAVTAIAEKVTSGEMTGTRGTMELESMVITKQKEVAV